MLQIIKAAILNCIRDKKATFFNIFFPVFLVVILGATLANNFGSDRSEDADIIQVLYINNGDSNTSRLLDTLMEMADEANMSFEEAESVEVGKQKVRVSNSVFIDIEGDKVNFYSNDQYIYYSSIAYGITKGVADSFNAMLEIYNVNPAALSEFTVVDSSEIFQMDLIPSTKSPSAKNYYGVAEIGLMIFYFFVIPLNYLKEERKINIKERIRLTGLSTSKYYFASFVGYSAVAYGSICISYLICRFVLRVNYGENLFIVPLAILPFVTFIIALGLFLSIVLKGEDKAVVVGSNIVIPLLCFLGGAYVPITEEFNSMLLNIAKISPLRWFNNGILRYIYAGDNSMLIQWIAIGTGITLVLLVCILIMGNREDAING